MNDRADNGFKILSRRSLANHAEKVRPKSFEQILMTWHPTKPWRNTIPWQSQFRTLVFGMLVGTLPAQPFSPLGYGCPLPCTDQDARQEFLGNHSQPPHRGWTQCQNGCCQGHGPDLEAKAGFSSGTNTKRFRSQESRGAATCDCPRDCDCRIRHRPQVSLTDTPRSSAGDGALSFRGLGCRCHRPSFCRVATVRRLRSRRALRSKVARTG